MADSKCSMVATTAPSYSMTVDLVVFVTLLQSAGTKGLPGKSIR